jgi:hypothetical protein
MAVSLAAPCVACCDPDFCSLAGDLKLSKDSGARVGVCRSRTDLERADLKSLAQNFHGFPGAERTRNELLGRGATTVRDFDLLLPLASGEDDVVQRQQRPIDGRSPLAAPPLVRRLAQHIHDSTELRGRRSPLIGSDRKRELNQGTGAFTFGRLSEQISDAFP